MKGKKRFASVEDLEWLYRGSTDDAELDLEAYWLHMTRGDEWHKKQFEKAWQETVNLPTPFEAFWKDVSDSVGITKMQERAEERTLRLIEGGYNEYLAGVLAVVLAIGDILPSNKFVEAVSGVDLTTGASLSGGERATRGVMAVGETIMLASGARGIMPPGVVNPPGWSMRTMGRVMGTAPFSQTGLQLSHWIIPARATYVPAWIRNNPLNLKPLSEVAHAVADPLKWSGMSAAFKAAMPMKGVFERFLIRTPTWARVAGTGGGIRVAGGILNRFVGGQ